jgi:Rad3-related DNA helicase
MCRALVVVGVPFPPISKKVADKRRQMESLEQKAITSN